MICDRTQITSDQKGKKQILHDLGINLIYKLNTSHTVVFYGTEIQVQGCVVEML